MCRFQLTTSRRGRLRSWRTLLQSVYFNSRPHEEVDSTKQIKLIKISISTHDLTRRSTLKHFLKLSYFGVFQLTTSRGGRQKCGGHQGKRLEISTHDLTRRSTPLFCIKLIIMQISTHDLTRRSTIISIHTNVYTFISTHDLTRRSTCRGGRKAGKRHFNSRPHEEVDQSFTLMVRLRLYFNSRPHEEVDC